MNKEQINVAIGMGIKTVQDYPEGYGLINKEAYDILVEIGHEQGQEIKRLKEALKITYASLCTYGEHPIIGIHVNSLLKG